MRKESTNAESLAARRYSPSGNRTRAARSDWDVVRRAPIKPRNHSEGTVIYGGQ
jgi:hypothetical protein